MFASAWIASPEIFAVSGRSPRCSGAEASASAPSIQSDDDGVIKPWAIRSARDLVLLHVAEHSRRSSARAASGEAGIVPTAR